MPGTAQNSCSETWWIEEMGQGVGRRCKALTSYVLYLHIYFYANLHRLLLIANIKVVIGAPPNSNIDPLCLFATFNQHISEIIFYFYAI